MTSFSSATRRALRPGALVLTVVAALAVPSAASAKTFVSHFTDPTGDADTSSHDLTNVRVAYNRRSGALSVSIQLAASIDTTSKDGAFVYISNLVGGRCTKPIMLIGGLFNHPDEAVAQRMNAQGVTGKQFGGVASVDGDTFSLRVKSRGLAGSTVGCAGAMVASVTPKSTSPTIFDETKNDNGFFG